MSKNPIEIVLMQMSENMLPMIEWAEGQRSMMIERGWSAPAAETYALEQLLGVSRLIAARMGGGS